MNSVPYFLAYDSNDKLIFRNAGAVKIEKIFKYFNEKEINNFPKLLRFRKIRPIVVWLFIVSHIRYYGGNDALENLREKSGTSKQGTTLLGLYQAANSSGFDAEGCGSRCKCTNRAWRTCNSSCYYG